MSQTTNLGPDLERGIWVAVIIAALIVILRCFASLQIKRFSLDDVLMIVAEILAIIGTVFLSLSVKHGFGKELTTIPFSDASLVLKYLTINAPFVSMSTTIARSAFILYLLRILGITRNYKVIIPLWTVLVIQFIGSTSSAILPLVICRDVRIFWDPTVKTTCGDAQAALNFFYFSNTFNSATDLFLAVFPAIIFWNLQLKTRIKVGLITLLSLGIFAMIASIIKTIKYTNISSLKTQGPGVETLRWGYIENAVIIITSSIPCIRPLFISSVRKFSSGRQTGTSQYELSAYRTKGNMKQSQRHSQPGFQKLDTPLDEFDNVELSNNTGQIKRDISVTVVSDFIE